MRADPRDEHLIDLIYSALLGEGSWQDFLDGLSRTIPGGKASLFFYDPGRNGGTLSITSGMTDRSVADFDKHFSRINPLMKRATLRPVGLGTVAEQMCARDEFVRTEFYNDFFKAIEAETAVGLTVMREVGCCFFLTNMTSRPDADENKPDADRLTRLSPHLRRAFGYYRTWRARDAVAQVGASLFDALEVGVVVVGERLVVRSASATAQKHIDAGVGVAITPAGKVRLSSSDAQNLLTAMLDRLSEGPRLATCLVRGVRLTLVRIRMDKYSEYFEGPKVAILMEAVASPGRNVDIRDFAQAHQLTAAEARALRGLVSGNSVSEIADQAKLSRETIRSQIKSLYAKTQVRSEADLLRLVSGFR